MSLRGWQGDQGQFDSALVARGEAILGGEALADGTEISSCTDCHDTIGSELNLEGDNGSGYPNLAEYASAKWLKAFIRDPANQHFYSDKNQMPAYGESKLSDEELDLLVRWMTGDYYPTTVKEYASQLDRLPAPAPVAVKAAE